MRRIGWTAVIVLCLAVVLLATATIYKRNYIDPKRKAAAVPEVELNQRLQEQP